MVPPWRQRSVPRGEKPSSTGMNKQNEEGSLSRLNNCWHCSQEGILSFDAGGDGEHGRDKVRGFQQSHFNQPLAAAVFDGQPSDDEVESSASHRAF